MTIGCCGDDLGREGFGIQFELYEEPTGRQDGLPGRCCDGSCESGAEDCQTEREV